MLVHCIPLAKACAVKVECIVTLVDSAVHYGVVLLLSYVWNGWAARGRGRGQMLLGVHRLLLLRKLIIVLVPIFDRLATHD
jgi:hypothetical protein